MQAGEPGCLRLARGLVGCCLVSLALGIETCSIPSANLNGTSDIDATCKSRTRELDNSRNTRPNGPRREPGPLLPNREKVERGAITLLISTHFLRIPIEKRIDLCSLSSVGMAHFHWQREISQGSKGS